MTTNKILERLNMIKENELVSIKVRNDSNNIILHLDDCKITLNTHSGSISLIENDSDIVRIKDIHTNHVFINILNRVIANDKVDVDIVKQYIQKIISSINSNKIKQFTTEIGGYRDFIINIGDTICIRAKEQTVVIHINGNRTSFIDELTSEQIQLIVLRHSFVSKTDMFINNIKNIKELKFDIDKI